MSVEIGNGLLQILFRFPAELHRGGTDFTTGHAFEKVLPPFRVVEWFLVDKKNESLDIDQSQSLDKNVHAGIQ